MLFLFRMFKNCPRTYSAWYHCAVSGGVSQENFWNSLRGIVDVTVFTAQDLIAKIGVVSSIELNFGGL